jgi:hypothetical protein
MAIFKRSLSTVGVLTAGLMLSGSAAFAAPSSPATSDAAQTAHATQDMHYGTKTPSLNPQVPTDRTLNPQGIDYMSGGIGADEQQRFEAARADYPVRVVFANDNGAYLSDVDVSLTDARGEIVLDIHTDGPILLLRPEPGTYTLSANENGQVKRQTITVGNAPKNYTLHFKANGPQDYSMQAGD